MECGHECESLSVEEVEYAIVVRIQEVLRHSAPATSREKKEDEKVNCSVGEEKEEPCWVR